MIIRLAVSFVILVICLLPVDLKAQTDPCGSMGEVHSPTSVRAALVRTACMEHANWNSPFIGLSGRAGWIDGKLRMEAESDQDQLADGTMPWVKVASYWSSTPAIDQMIALDFPGASDCARPQDFSQWSVQASCRAFIVSNAWSAAFISHIARQSGIGDFQHSHKHITYIKAAHDAGASAPYRLADVKSEKPAAGDLLCYSRAPGIASYSDLLRHIKSGSDSLNTHCDVVVAANLNGDSKVYVVGGNVLQTVMMRKLSLDASGYLSTKSTTRRPACHINAESGCSLSYKNWIALLKLQRD